MQHSRNNMSRNSSWALYTLRSYNFWIPWSWLSQTALNHVPVREDEVQTKNNHSTSTESLELFTCTLTIPTLSFTNIPTCFCVSQCLGLSRRNGCAVQRRVHGVKARWLQEHKEPVRIYLCTQDNAVGWANSNWAALLAYTSRLSTQFLTSNVSNVPL